MNGKLAVQYKASSKNVVDSHGDKKKVFLLDNFLLHFNIKI